MPKHKLKNMNMNKIYYVLKDGHCLDKFDDFIWQNHMQNIAVVKYTHHIIKQIYIKRHEKLFNYI